MKTYSNKTSKFSKNGKSKIKRHNNYGIPANKMLVKIFVVVFSFWLVCSNIVIEASNAYAASNNISVIDNSAPASSVINSNSANPTPVTANNAVSNADTTSSSKLSTSSTKTQTITNTAAPSTTFNRLLPLVFETNVGQTDAQVKFLAHGRGYNFYLTSPSEAVLDLHRSTSATNGKAASTLDLTMCQALLEQNTKSSSSNAISSSALLPSDCQADPAKEQTNGLALKFTVQRANTQAQIIGENPLSGKTNYFLGNTSKKWLSNVQTFSGVVINNIYPGVNLHYGSSPEGLVEYTFEVTSNADPNQIGLAIDGAERQGITSDGQLVLHSRSEKVLQTLPAIYQLKADGITRQYVSGIFVSRVNSFGKTEVGFSVNANYDHSKPLFIDPVLNYANYLGNNGVAVGQGVTLDHSGNIYVAGWTNGGFPTTIGAYQSSHQSGGNDDIFVIKLNPNAPTSSQLVYASYFGGSKDDVAYGVSVDSNGRAYITGSTSSSDFPVSSSIGSEFQPNLAAGSGKSNVFVSELSADGTQLVYSSYLGGNGSDCANGIALDASGNIYLTGFTYSNPANGTGFPITTGAYQNSWPGGNFEVFFTKINPNATTASGQLLYSTFLGGTGSSDAQGIAVDGSGNVYLAGYVTGNYPFVNGYSNSYNGGGSDVFVSRFTPNNTTYNLTYSSYLGGSNFDFANAIAVDSSGDAFITGRSYLASGFPTKGAGGNPYQSTNKGQDDVFVTKISTTQTFTNSLTYSTLIGGAGDENATGIAIDSSGNAYVTGYTTGSYPITSGAYQTTYKGGSNDVFVTKLNPYGTGLVYSTYLGGSNNDIGEAIAVDNSGDAIVVGSSTSPDYPTTSNAYQAGLDGAGSSVGSVFITELNSNGNGLLYSGYIGGANSSTYGIAVDSSGSAYITGRTSSLSYPTTTGAYQTSSASNGYYDAFVTKFTPDGNGVIFSTYLGGNGSDTGGAIAVDNNSGQIYIGGSTSSTNFPTVGAYQNNYQGGGSDGFVARLSADGSTLQYSTYLGGLGRDAVEGLAIDTNSNAYVTGYTQSSNYPTSTVPIQSNLKAVGAGNAFVTELNTNLSGIASIVYSTYLGGSSDGYGHGIAVDNNGYIYIAGGTASTDFTTTTNAYLRTNPSTYPYCACVGYLTKINPNGSTPTAQLLYSTYLAGTGSSFGWAVAADSSGNAYELGGVSTPGFPTTAPTGYTPYKSSYDGIGSTPFVAKVNTNLAGGSSLIYSTLLAGNGSVDAHGGLSIDSNGNAYVTGYLTSTTFPTTAGTYQSSYGGGNYDAYILKLNATGSGVLYASYLGGGGDDYGQAIAVDNQGSVYVAGQTTSSSFANVGGGIYSTTTSAGPSAFVIKLALLKLAFTVQPGGNGAIVGSALPSQPQVTVQNMDGSVATSYSGPVSLTIKPNTGTPGANLLGQTTVNAVNGVANYTGISLDQPGTGYILTARSGLLTSQDSVPFTVTGITGTNYLVATGGTPQSATINTPFANRLQATLKNANNVAVSGVVVTFLAYTTGPRGTFAGYGPVITATTDTNGIATANAAFIANGQTGTYTVTATASGVSSPANFVLTNTPASVGPVLTLVPIASGPNPLNSTVAVSATLTGRNRQPLAGYSVNFTVTGSAGVATLTLNATTNSNGVATVSYSRAMTSTDSVQATASITGNPTAWSNIGTIYWRVPIFIVTSSDIQGSFYFNTAGSDFRATPASTPVFTQTFPDIDFPQISTFVDTILDSNGIAVGNITAAGNGYTAGVGNLYNFDAVFTGQFVVSQPTQFTFFDIYDDNYIFGIGNGATKVTNTCGNYNPNVQNTIFLQYPVMSYCSQGNYSEYLTVNFPTAGVYPFEVDYTQKYGAPMGVSIQDKLRSNGINAAGTIALTTTNFLTPTLNQTVSFTATLEDAAGVLVPNQAVVLSINGANNQLLNGITNQQGQATFTYTGTLVGTDTAQAIGWVNGMAAVSNQITPITWSGTQSTGTGGGGGPESYGCGSTSSSYPIATPGWLASPVAHNTYSGTAQISIMNSSSETLNQTCVDYWPVANPTASGIQKLISTTTQILPSSVIATLDPTTLANGSYVVRLRAKDSSNNYQDSETLFTVVGDNKPGRVVFTVNDFTVPLAGLPIQIGRTYDSLNRNVSGDFGNGWNLSIGTPKLEVNPAHDVTLTLPDGSRKTFYFNPNYLPLGFQTPNYSSEPGEYGTLTSDGCGLMVIITGGQYACFPGGLYQPSTYYYTDPYGRVFTIGADGKMQSIRDLNGNVLTFSPNGITSTVGYGVSFQRDSSNRITVITDTMGNAYKYGYDDTTRGSIGDLTSYKDPVAPISTTYTYYTTGNLTHLFKSAIDARNITQVTTYYDTNGRIISATDALSNTTTFGYNLANNSTTITNPDKGVTTNYYDSYGKVLTTTDPYGTTSNVYDANHNVLTTTDQLGHSTSYQYDSAGNQIATTNALNNTSTKSYNQYKEPTVITDTLGNAQTVNYDPNTFNLLNVNDSIGPMGGYTWNDKGSPLSLANGLTQTTQYGYDNFGNVTVITDAMGLTTTMTYDNMGHKTSMTDGNSNVTKYQYDALGHNTVITSAANTVNPVVVTNTYDSVGNLSSTTDGNGHKTQYYYDGNNHVITTTFADNSIITDTYDFRGNKTSERDQAGHITFYQYDLSGRVLTTTTAYGTVDAISTVNGYDAAGRVITTTDGLGHQTISSYDNANQLIKSTDSLMHSTVYTYDARGLRTNMQDAGGMVITYAYNARSELITTTYPGTYNGAVISSTQQYDLAGRVVTSTDQMGHQTYHWYYTNGWLESVTDPLSHTVSYYYDKVGNLQKMSDALTHTTVLTYTALNQLQQKSWPDAKTTESFLYDGAGNEISHTVANGGNSSTITSTYDVMNRLAINRYPDATPRFITYTYTADGLPNLITDSVRSTTSPVTYNYDNQNRVISIYQPGNSSYITYTYDANNNRKGMATFTGGTQASNISYSYNTDNSLYQVTQNSSNTATYQYYPNGERQQLTLPNGVKVKYGYDTLNRMTGITQTTSIGSPLANYNYSLDAAGMRTNLAETLNGTTSNVAWNYDADYRVLTETRTGGTNPYTSSYSYDNAGNRQTWTLSTGGTVNYTYNALDQISSSTTGSSNLTYNYDLRGNLTSITGGSSSPIYSYNSANELTSASVNGTQVASFQYDAMGHRVQLTASGVITNYLWDEESQYGDVALESSGSNNISYVLGGNEILWQNQSGALSYLLHDGQGSTRMLVDGTGNIVNANGGNQLFTYDAFGNLQSGGAYTAPATEYLYDDQQFDNNSTKLYDMRARYYSPSDGRFLSRDTNFINTQNPVELNRYVYTANDPTNFSDPSGKGLLEFISIEKPIALLKVLSIALVGEISFFYLTLLVSSIQIHEILNSYAQITQCTQNSGQPVCTFFLNHDGTIQLANLFSGWANFFNTVTGDPSFIEGVGFFFITEFTTFLPFLKGVLGKGVSLLVLMIGWMSINQITRLNNEAAIINQMASANNNTGKIWASVPDSSNGSWINIGPW